MEHAHLAHTRQSVRSSQRSSSHEQAVIHKGVDWLASFGICARGGVHRDQENHDEHANDGACKLSCDVQTAKYPVDRVAFGLSHEEGNGHSWVQMPNADASQRKGDDHVAEADAERCRSETIANAGHGCNPGKELKQEGTRELRRHHLLILSVR
eukprot:756064-Hanusia_phi.AAC.1